MSEPFRILLVEDNDADVYLFRKALESAELNFELTILQDGAQALAFVRREGKYAASPVPDLAVMDLNMPKNDGVEVLEAIRNSEWFSNMPVVITSSSASPRDQNKVARLGIERYVQKPNDLEVFLSLGAVFKQILHERGTRRLPAARA
jgi:two-component system, chemotaxis family, response regulator Rcp1